MADVIDKAEEALEILLKARIEENRKVIDTSNPTGRCLYCGEPTGTNRRWCDADCARAWEEEEKRRK